MDAADTKPQPTEQTEEAPPAEADEAETEVRCTLCGLRACWTGR